MLVLSRKESEAIQIGNDVRLTILSTSGRRVTLGIEAPDDHRILRGEVIDRAAQPSEAGTTARRGDVRRRPRFAQRSA